MTTVQLMKVKWTRNWQTKAEKTRDQPTEADMTRTQFIAPELLKTVEMDRKRQDQPKVMRVQFREAEMTRVPVTGEGVGDGDDGRNDRGSPDSFLKDWKSPNKKQR